MAERPTPDDLLAEAASREEGEAVAQELLRKDREISRLKSQLRTFRLKYKHAVEQLDVWEQREEIIAVLEDGGKPAQILPSVPSNQPTSAIIVMTDWHVEERVDPSTVNGLNEYTPEIASQRIDRAFAKAVELIQAWSRAYPVDEIVLALLGDFITGYIHDELKESNLLSPTEALLMVQEKIEGGIEFLLRELRPSSVIIPTCFGNHGRTTDKKKIATAHLNSFEWMLYRVMAKAYADHPVVTWKVENGIHNWLTIQGHDFRFHHGDYIRYGGGVGGITIPVNKKIAGWNRSRKAACDVFGHWHQFLEAQNFVACPCLIGYGPFAQSLGFAFEEPAQSLILTSRRHGKVAALPIFAT